MPSVSMIRGHTTPQPGALFRQMLFLHMRVAKAPVCHGHAVKVNLTCPSQKPPFYGLSQFRTRLVGFIAS
jgi:hypothetical protein